MELGPPKPYAKRKGPAHREKSMKVLALGMSRTGTMSLYVALRKLGLHCYHMKECGLDAANNSMVYWHEAIEAKYNNKGRRYVGEDFDKMLWRYEAVSDIPCILFVDELLAAYPDAKIILTNRDVESWKASLERSFYTILSWKRWAILELLDRQLVHHYLPILRSALTVWAGGNWQDKSKLAEGYASHYAHVRKAASAAGRDVLNFRSQDGWEPLCQFLGKAVPEEPYPYINEGNSAVELHYFIFWMRFLVVLISILKWTTPISVVILAVWYYYLAKS